MKIDITIKDISSNEASSLIDFLKKFGSEPEKQLDLFKNAEIEKEIVQQNLEASINDPAALFGQQPISNEEEPVNNVSEGELDITGLPWDARIHASTKSKVKQGFWTRKRNISDEEYDRIAAEILNKTPSTGGNIIVQPANNPAIPVITQATVSPQQVAVQIPAPQPVLANPVVAPNMTGYAGLINVVSNLFATQQATPEYMNSVTSRISQAFQVQVNTIGDIMNNEAMINYAFDVLRVDGKIQ